MAKKARHRNGNAGQHSFDGLSRGWTVQSALNVVVDFGSIGKTLSSPHRVLAENGGFYLAKGGSFSQRNPNGRINEWITYEICNHLGYPVLDHRLLQMEGEIYFGSQFLEPSSFDMFSFAIIQRCENPQVLYDVAVLDVWLTNPDRHNRNLLVRKAAGGRKLIVPNDHDCSIMPPGTTPGDLGDRVDYPCEKCIVSTDMVMGIEQPEMLMASIEKAQQVTDHDIRRIVQSTPSSWVSSEDRKMIEEFIVVRRQSLKETFKSNQKLFPFLLGELK